MSTVGQFNRGEASNAKHFKRERFMFDWVFNPEMSDFPDDKELTLTLKDKRYGERKVVRKIPVNFLIYTKCKQIMWTYVIRSDKKPDRLHGLAEGEMPLAWMEIEAPEKIYVL